MSPTTGIAASQLRQLIFYHIDNDFLDNANFLAGRLLALEPRNPDSSHLLSLTYLRLRKFKAAYDFSQKHGSAGRHLGCAYVFSQACLELGRYTEGTNALDKSKALWGGKNNWSKHSENSRRHLPDTPAAWTLLGKLWQAHGDWRKAGDCFVEAHKANPFIWDAFDGLCTVGADLSVSNMFKLPPELAATATVSSAGPATSSIAGIFTDDPPPALQPLGAQQNFNQQILTPSTDPFMNSRTSEDSSAAIDRFAKGKAVLSSALKHAASDWDTPVANGGITDEDIDMGDQESILSEPPAAPARRHRLAQNFESSDRPRQPALRGHLQSTSETTQAEEPPKRPMIGLNKRNISGHQAQATASTSSDPSAPRRSDRLFGQARTTRTTRTTADSTSSLASKVDRTLRGAKPATGAKGRTTVGRVVSGNRRPDLTEKDQMKRAPSRPSDKSVSVGVASTVSQKPATSTAPGRDVEAEIGATNVLLDHFRQLATGCYATSRFELPKAIQTFKSFPSAQRETPWVLAQLGKAYYEAADYRNAEECFARVMKIQPSRIEDMEVYSTVLWHMKKESALACLCHTLKEQAFEAPQTWVAIGNAFSLAREHDQAISAFKRATQLDPSFAYAWTLMGHESIANEDYDAALAAFRKSISTDRRGYGGWYGLGKSYEKLGKFDDAERHYRIAASINPSNATLLVCIGVVLERLRDRDGALSNYTKALELAPTSALARFKKARVLMNLRAFDHALAELEILRDQAPDEANVWFLLGKCYKGLGQKSEALRALTTALNLDVKAAPFIKEAMEALDDDDEESDDD
ncbi:Hypothetical protein R9X50_00608600 [Acrodontium crateriforme]|uniref:TPR-like protein n=1 Tax=Acrodontium crateriforme TaxID=150365 RepID=A0AAQ3R9M1_9PEZI|nr:Hypothetical protein R9X50_00608600 [Acrodontium crateriforme]